MYAGAALSFGLIRVCRSGLVLYCSVLSDAGGQNDGSSAIFEISLLIETREVLVGNEDVVGAALTGDAPTVSEWQNNVIAY